MNILSFFLIFHLLVFLFCLYVLVQDDFVLLRKNVSMEQAFNLAFLVIFIGFLTARIVYITLHFNPSFLNPIVFFAFPYYPGLSLIGEVAGGSLFLFLYARYRKYPVARLFDFFSFSFFCALSFGYLNTILFEKKPLQSWDFLLSLSYLVVFILFSIIFLPLQRRGALKDGNLGLMVMLIFAVFAFALNVIQHAPKVIGIFCAEDFIILGFFAAAFLFIIIRNNARKKTTK